MRKLIIVVVLILLWGCKPKFKTIIEPYTKVTTKIKTIDSSKFKFLKDTFNLECIYVPDSCLGALSPNNKIVYGLKNNYFYKNFGEERGRKIIVEKDNKYILIDNFDNFKAFFAPVNSKEMAISYVCAMTNSMPIYGFDYDRNYRYFVKESHITNVKDTLNGYKVLLFDYKLYGCGPHPTYSVEYYVSKSGDVSIIESIKIYENPEEDNLCVD